MASSSSNTRSQMTLFEVKNAMQGDMLYDSRCQKDLWEVIKKLEKQKDGFKAGIKHIQKCKNTNLETLYTIYLQEKLEKVDQVIGMVYDAHFALQEALTHAEMWQTNIGDEKTIESVKCPSVQIKNPVPRKY